MDQTLNLTVAELRDAGRRALAPSVHRLAADLGARATAHMLVELAVEAAAADGLDRRAVAEALREIADEIEAGKTGDGREAGHA